MLSVIIVGKSDTSKNIVRNGRKECKNEKGKENEANYENDKDGDEKGATTILVDFLIFYEDEMINFASYDTNWVIDSGAPFKLYRERISLHHMDMVITKL